MSFDIVPCLLPYFIWTPTIQKACILLLTTVFCMALPHSIFIHTTGNISVYEWSEIRERANQAQFSQTRLCKPHANREVKQIQQAKLKPCKGKYVEYQKLLVEFLMFNPASRASKSSKANQNKQAKQTKKSKQANKLACKRTLWKMKKSPPTVRATALLP